jgi:hypothetical protein
LFFRRVVVQRVVADLRGRPTLPRTIAKSRGWAQGKRQPGGIVKAEGLGDGPAHGKSAIAKLRRGFPIATDRDWGPRLRLTLPPHHVLRLCVCPATRPGRSCICSAPCYNALHGGSGCEQGGSPARGNGRLLHGLCYSRQVRSAREFRADGRCVICKCVIISPNRGTQSAIRNHVTPGVDRGPQSAIVSGCCRRVGGSCRRGAAVPQMSVGVHADEVCSRRRASEGPDHVRRRGTGGG